MQAGRVEACGRLAGHDGRSAAHRRSGGAAAASLAAAAALVMVAASGRSAGPQNPSPEVSALLSSHRPVVTQAVELAAGQPRFALGSDGFVRRLCAHPRSRFLTGTPADGKPEETAREFMRGNAHAFGLVSGRTDLRVLGTGGREKTLCVRFGQTYDGIPVFGAEVIVQVDESGGVEYVLSDIARDLSLLDSGDVPTKPRLSAEQATAAAMAACRRNAPAAELSATTPRLGIFDPAVLESKGPLRLVWILEVYSGLAPDLNRRMLVDAHTGVVVRGYPLCLPARNRQIFDAGNSPNNPGTLLLSEGGQPTSTVADVNTAYLSAGNAYDYFSSNHGRDSYDNAGMEISVTVRYQAQAGQPWRNAVFNTNDYRIYIGGDWAVDDIVAHEFTHGVTCFESGLIYENHSGAINESFSDVWGEFVDLANGTGNDGPAVRWLIGEDLLSGPLRDMSNPPTNGHPDRLGSPLFVPPTNNPTAGNDYGGVHANCGVNNKLCCLLTDGGTFNGFTVSAIGTSAVSRLYMEVNANLLTSAADYYDLYHALRQAAVNFGWNRTQRGNLYRACQAVEIVDAVQDIYVDAANTGAEDGTLAHPYNTVAEGNNAAWPGDRLHVKGTANYDETVTFEIPMKVESYGGAATIGQ